MNNQQKIIKDSDCITVVDGNDTYVFQYDEIYETLYKFKHRKRCDCKCVTYSHNKNDSYVKDFVIGKCIGEYTLLYLPTGYSSCSSYHSVIICECFITKCNEGLTMEFVANANQYNEMKFHITKKKELEVHKDSTDDRSNVNQTIDITKLEKSYIIIVEEYEKKIKEMAEKISRLENTLENSISLENSIVFKTDNEFITKSVYEKKTKMDLSWENIKSIEKIIGCYQLESISLISCSIVSIYGLNNLPNLKELNLEHNNISVIEGLRNLDNLNTLILSLNKINKLTGLEKLINLNVLRVNNNMLSCIEGLNTCTKIKYLELVSNYITKIEGLDNLNMLKLLDLSINKICKIENLENLHSLEYLYLRMNQITEVPTLSYLTLLKDLYVGENPILKPNYIIHI